MDTIQEVKVNISLLTMLKFNPKYNKMIKDSMAHTHAIGDIDYMEKILMGGQCVASVVGKLPPR